MAETLDRKGLLDILALCGQHVQKRENANVEQCPWHVSALLALQEAAKICFPSQYNHSDWVLGRANQELRGKYTEPGNGILPGQLILVKPRSELCKYLNNWQTTVWSPLYTDHLGTSIYDVEIL